MTADLPAPQGLYDGAHEHDACGVAFVADMHGRASHDIVVKALTALRNLEHRGAQGAEPETGDGAGILLQVPDALLRAVVDFALPPARAYAVGTAFLPADDAQEQEAMRRIEAIAGEEELRVLGWRQLPTDGGQRRRKGRLNCVRSLQVGRQSHPERIVGHLEPRRLRQQVC